jgi:L-asparagine transporter-like permease
MRLKVVSASAFGTIGCWASMIDVWLLSIFSDSDSFGARAPLQANKVSGLGITRENMRFFAEDRIFSLMIIYIMLFTRGGREVVGVTVIRWSRGFKKVSKFDPCIS